VAQTLLSVLAMLGMPAKIDLLVSSLLYNIRRCILPKHRQECLCHTDPAFRCNLFKYEMPPPRLRVSA
jgi:hypothetical protein